MADSQPALNYQLIKDDADKFRQFLERFVRLGDAVASVGPLEEHLNTLNARIAERQAELADLDEKKAKATEDIDAAIAAANAEAKRIIEAANVDAATLKDAASDEVAKINAAAADEHARQVAQRDAQIGLLNVKIAERAEKVTTLDGLIVGKQASLQELDQKHAALELKMDAVKQAALRALE